MRPIKIISGGQTGVDTAALRTAKRLGIATGGTAPKGWRTEDGSNQRELEMHGLVEHASGHYQARTKQNIMDSDGTVLFGSLTGGTLLTEHLCHLLKKPCAVNPGPAELRWFVACHEIRILNVAGSRLSKNPQAAVTAAETLFSAFDI